MDNAYKRGILFIVLFFLLPGLFELTAQTDIANASLVTSVSKHRIIVNRANIQADVNVEQNYSPDKAMAYQQALEIDLSISAAALYKHAKPGHLSIRNLGHCFIKDNNLGKPKNYGFFLFNLFQAINHVRDFTSDIVLPAEEGIKTIQWKIVSLDIGYDCEFIKLVPLGKSKRINIFRDQSLSTDKKSIQINITPDTEEGNYRYAVHFKVNDKTYIIDPRVKIHQ